MEPGVRFARASDGVTVAYWAMGEGSPLVVMPSMPWSHLQLEWTIPQIRRWYEGLGNGRQLVRYDGRGFGSSGRDVVSMSLDAQVRDLEAVVDAVGLEGFDLYAGLHSGPPAIAYAVEHPGRLRHLVLFCAYADGAIQAASSLTHATRPIILQDWQFYSQVVARVLLGWAEPEAAQRFAELVEESTTPEIAAAALSATAEYDVTGQLADVAVPTLVIARHELSMAGGIDHGRTLAAAIPGARFVMLEGTSVAPYIGDVDAVLGEIDGFLTGGATVARIASPPGALRTILFTDVEGSTSLTQRLGDDGARQAMREHEEIMRSGFRESGGTEIKAMGDGFMASFGSAVAAVRCAIALQRGMAARNAGADEPIRIRVGINAGEPIAEEDDLFGTAVIAASRIGSRARPGEILVSDVVRQLVAGKGIRFLDRGEVVLRGFEHPTRLHSVAWETE
jgi:class 3 adenylate cyclase